MLYNLSKSVGNTKNTEEVKREDHRNIFADDQVFVGQ